MYVLCSTLCHYYLLMFFICQLLVYFFNILCIFVFLFCIFVFYFVYSVFLYCLCIVSPFVYVAVSLLFLKKFTYHCHRVEKQLQ